LLLAPGASADRNQSTLVAIDNAVAAHGVAPARIDLPSRAPAAVARVTEAAAELAAQSGLAQDHVALGGRSFGGRMASMAVAAGLPALGLVLVSYPLHPPGKPDKLRVEHFGDLHVPCLFVSGTRDPFGTPGELENAAKAIKGPVTMRLLEGGDHGLRGRDAEVAELVVEALVSWVP
jgi:predicted alpha/beta-hydrolase family hydrolase